MLGKNRIRTRWVSYACFCLAALLVATGFVVPLQSAQPIASPKPKKRREVKAQPKSDRPKIPTDTLMSAAKRPLQRQLFDPPPKPVKPKPVVHIPPPKVKLLMVLMGDPSRAMFRDSAGKCIYKKVGEDIKDRNSSAKLVEIHEDHVVLSHNEKLLTVSMNGS